MLLGGVVVATGTHLAGHSDGDAVAHALTDAILGAASAGDIGAMYPDTDASNLGRDSIEMLKAAAAVVSEMGFELSNVDVTVVAESPKIGPYRDAMRQSLGDALGLTPDRVSIKGKTNEGMGWIGKGEGLACIAIATLIRAADGPRQ